MKRIMIASVLLLFSRLVPVCQEPPSITSPTEGATFGDGENVCVSLSANPFAQEMLNIAGPMGSGRAISPFFPSLDNGFCLPREVQPWDPPLEFSLESCDLRGCSGPVHCLLQPSGSAVPPGAIVLKEVSFRKKNGKFYVRLVALDVASDKSCLHLHLGNQNLPITRCRLSGGAATIEGLIGREQDFIGLASGMPDIALADSCTGRESYLPPVPPGKQVIQYAQVVYNSSTKNVIMVGVGWTPLTRCEVLFYSWYDPKTSSWAIKNYPTYLKYGQSKDPEGYLPHSHRKLWKPGVLVWRAYDYCTGEFVGFGLGGSLAEAGQPDQGQACILKDLARKP